MALPARVLTTMLLVGMLAGSRLYGGAALLFSVDATPKVALDGEGVWIKVIVPRESRNRRLRVDVDGPVSRAFEEPLDGEDARVTYSLQMQKLPAGFYEVTGRVLHADGSIARALSHFCRGEACSTTGDDPF